MTFDPRIFNIETFFSRAQHFHHSHQLEQSANLQILAKPPALANLGLSCFLNSVIQSLFSCEEFRDLLLRSEMKLRVLVIPLSNELNPLEVFVSKPLGPVGRELCSLFKAMSTHENLQITPRSFLSVCQKHLRDFSIEMMHDSHEFLISLLNCISQEITSRVLKIIKNNIKANPDTFTSNVNHSPVYQQSIPDFFNEEIFQGTMISEVVCSQCLNRTSNIEKFIDLSLPVFNQFKKSNREKFKKFFGLKSNTTNFIKAKFKASDNGHSSKFNHKNLFSYHIFASKPEPKQECGKNWMSLNEFSVLPPIERSCEFESLHMNISDSWKDAKSWNGLTVNDKHVIHIRNKSDGSQSCSECEFQKITVPLPENDGHFKDGPNSTTYLRRSKSLILGKSCSFKPFVSQTLSVLSLNRLNYHTDEGRMRYLSYCNDTTYTFMSCVAKHSESSISREVDDREIFSDSNQTSLQTCLETFFSTEVFDQSNKISCENCSAKNGTITFSIAKRKLRIMELPKVLIIHLKRFRQTMTKLSKLTKHISFTEYIEMDQFCQTRKKAVFYRLFSVIQHCGIIDEGHYTSFVRYCSSNNRWFLTNDYTIREVSIETVLGCEAYILFYRKCE
ncbi:Ubiquitin carboxyl-terminal hydrolase 16 [Thelohanellus kitauei]|uniref:ubiquitinyl hydrolase 1 n=1 Tax=Thelohanellus kitauei TaxID=669202 RepID=A0A0C2NAC4_THEKT|nr:Ubiquitin carboxyl-terminal hydrolase 16 [Thelohanellus kitauei]